MNLDIQCEPKTESFTLFDSHCHFDALGDEEQQNIIWRQCHSKGISRLFIPGVEQEQWMEAKKICQHLDGIVMGVGLHPWFLKEANPIPVDSLLNSYLDDTQCVAVGECGLDAALDLSLQFQVNVFEQHIKLACDKNLPLIIHVRKTHNEMLRLLKKYQSPSGGVIHGFTGSFELAKEYWSLGFYLGIGGSITYPRANKTRNAVKKMPIESLVLETDAPYMPLKGYQGEANSPLRLLEIAECLSRLRCESINSICINTTKNSQKLFAL